MRRVKDNEQFLTIICSMMWYSGTALFQAFFSSEITLTFWDNENFLKIREG